MITPHFPTTVATELTEQSHDYSIVFPLQMCRKMLARDAGIIPLKMEKEVKSEVKQYIHRSFGQENAASRYRVK